MVFWQVPVERWGSLAGPAGCSLACDLGRALPCPSLPQYAHFRPRTWPLGAVGEGQAVGGHSTWELLRWKPPPLRHGPGSPQVWGSLPGSVGGPAGFQQPLWNPPVFQEAAWGWPGGVEVRAVWPWLAASSSSVLPWHTVEGGPQVPRGPHPLETAPHDSGKEGVRGVSSDGALCCRRRGRGTASPQALEGSPPPGLWPALGTSPWRT